MTYRVKIGTVILVFSLLNSVASILGTPLNRVLLGDNTFEESDGTSGHFRKYLISIEFDGNVSYIGSDSRPCR